MKKLILLICLPLILMGLYISCSDSDSSSPNTTSSTTADVVDKYVGNWYNLLTFSKRTVTKVNTTTISFIDHGMYTGTCTAVYEGNYPSDTIWEQFTVTAIENTNSPYQLHKYELFKIENEQWRFGLSFSSYTEAYYNQGLFACSKL